MKPSNMLIKNGKFFVQPDAGGRDFKVLFKNLAAAGAGRPVDENGFPKGPWTADLLAEAISLIDANRAGIELRTVQLWFQDNDKGISPENIRWLARIFGCDDPKATSAWQAELSASQRQLVAQRRERQKSLVSSASEASNLEEIAVEVGDGIVIDADDDLPDDTQPKRRFSLARTSEAIFGGGSFLDLPVSVFAGAAVLGFMSVFLGVHSITYAENNGPLKQVGFFWAPNWTLLFMVFLPLFLGFCHEVIAFWKNEGRDLLVAASGSTEGNNGWLKKVEASPLTYWSVFLVCIGFAGLFQWVSVRLLPLIDGSRDYAIDWGSIGIIRPELTSVMAQAFFTGIAYLYMCLCFYLFFVGLILLYTLAYDYRDIKRQSERVDDDNLSDAILGVSAKISRGVFRCAISGILIAICMKLQSVYLVTDSSDIISWFVNDFLAVTVGNDTIFSSKDFSTPNQYTSMLIVMVTVFTFAYVISQVGLARQFGSVPVKMAGCILSLVIAYTAIGMFDGFSIILGLSILLAAYGLFDPWLGSRSGNVERRVDVS